MGGSQLWSTGCPGKAPSGPGQFVYLTRRQIRPIAAPTGHGLPLQANGGCRKWRGARDVLDTLPAVPIGLEQQTMASGNRDRPNLRMQQDQIWSLVEILKEEREDILSFKLSGESKRHELLKQLETEKRKTVSEFQQLRQFLEEQERLQLAQLDELNKEIEKGRAEYVAKLSEEISSFSSLITEMEQKCQQPASEFLQDIKDILSRCGREQFQNPVAFSSELKWRIWESSQRNASLKTIMKKFKGLLSSRQQLHKVNVTLDPDTAHHDLTVSADRKSVRWGDTEQDPPDNPERFDSLPCVLGCAGFTSGRHYWEVEMEREGVCVVGVAKESVSRKGWISLNRKGGIWAVECSEDQYQALTSPVQHIALSPSQAPRRIRVYLDYEQRQVAFFDAGNGDLIITFPPASFAGERIHPFFWVDLSVRLL
ncbi:unnamed protein product [Eretmochelys imbricata]